VYLDDDSADPLVVRLLGQAGHDVQGPVDVGLVGEDDPIHLTYAIEKGRAFLSGNHDDFLNLHNLILRAEGYHPGTLVVRRDNDPRRDLTPRGLVVAVGNLEAARVPLPSGFFILNHWR